MARKRGHHGVITWDVPRLEAGVITGRTHATLVWRYRTGTRWIPSPDPAEKGEMLAIPVTGPAIVELVVPRAELDSAWWWNRKNGVEGESLEAWVQARLPKPSAGFIFDPSND